MRVKCEINMFEKSAKKEHFLILIYHKITTFDWFGANAFLCQCKKPQFSKLSN